MITGSVAAIPAGSSTLSRSTSAIGFPLDALEHEADERVAEVRVEEPARGRGSIRASRRASPSVEGDRLHARREPARVREEMVERDRLAHRAQRKPGQVVRDRRLQAQPARLDLAQDGQGGERLRDRADLEERARRDRRPAPDVGMPVRDDAERPLSIGDGDGHARCRPLACHLADVEVEPVESGFDAHGEPERTRRAWSTWIIRADGVVDRGSPVLWSPELVYLNTASFGLPPRARLGGAAGCACRLARRPHELGALGRRRPRRRARGGLGSSASTPPPWRRPRPCRASSGWSPHRFRTEHALSLPTSSSAPRCSRSSSRSSGASRCAPCP